MNQAQLDYTASNPDQPYCCLINEGGWHLRDCRECRQMDCIKSDYYDPDHTDFISPVWEHRLEKISWAILFLALVYFLAQMARAVLSGWM